MNTPAVAVVTILPCYSRYILVRMKPPAPSAAVPTSPSSSPPLPRLWGRVGVVDQCRPYPLVEWVVVAAVAVAAACSRFFFLNVYRLRPCFFNRSALS